MKQNRTAALLYENDNGHLDHLAPYCSVHDIPLFLTSPYLFKAAKEQYEQLTIHLLAPNSVCRAILENYDMLISTLPKQLLDPLFLLDEMLLQKKLKTYWLPHGLSDKKNMHALTQEEHLLVYGEQMKAMLPEHVQSKCTFTGNFRWKYYHLHKNFYDALLKKWYPEIFSQQNILYAPSWEMPNLIDWIEALVSKKSAAVHLYIKLHPNTYLSPEGAIITEKFKQSDKIFFIKDFFPIYPIIDKMSALFTDISSVGYDFLTFNRPIFFTTKNDDPLHKHGIEVDQDDPYRKI
ncbi:MAG: hypothetical protein SP4CHLAM5_06680 [Chlamydiia bacterium]|nr:hypothetical protein [Chlamydiia bacterium]MCH9618535.1 hypothetical protein [Chlamydiia bacterium]MCH9624243.1 hypothetical protein [Chlamydiia bacterium]